MYTIERNGETVFAHPVHNGYCIYNIMSFVSHDFRYIYDRATLPFQCLDDWRISFICALINAAYKMIIKLCLLPRYLK